MKVFRIETNPEVFAFFFPTDGDELWLDDFDGTSEADYWEPPVVRLHNEDRLPSDFLNYSNACLIASPRATERLQRLFKMSGELLSLPYEGNNYSLLNVTNLIECLDHDQTVWNYTLAEYGPSFPTHILSYSFRSEALSRSPIFKIPETCHTDIYVTEGFLHPEEEFREIVRRENLQGIVFTKIWSDEEWGGERDHH